MTTLLWFKRDLRIHDHPALALAARDDRVVPLYIVEPEYWALPDTSGRQYAFLQESLSDLQTALRHLGSDLVIRVGDAVTVFQELYQTVKFDHVISHEETGNTWTFARDKRVAAWARRQGVRWTERPQSGVVRRLQGRDGWEGSVMPLSRRLRSRRQRCCPLATCRRILCQIFAHQIPVPVGKRGGVTTRCHCSVAF